MPPPGAIAGVDMGGTFTDVCLIRGGARRVLMARALRRVSTERGMDPSRLALVAFGGAGPCSAAVFDPAGEMVAQAEPHGRHSASG